MKRCVLIVLLIATTLQSVATALYSPATNQHYFFYLCAQYSQLQPQRVHLAQQYYAQLFLLKAPVFTLAGYLEHLFQLQHFEAIVRLLPDVGTNFKNNKDVQVIIGQALELTGRPYEAETIFINLYPNCKVQPDVAYYAAAAHARRANYNEAFTIIDDYINNTTQRQTHSIFYVLKSKIHQSLNQHAQAAEALKKAVTLYSALP